MTVVKKALKIAITIVLVVIMLAIALVVLTRTYIHIGPYKSWEEHGIGRLLPSLSDALGKSEDEFYVEGDAGSRQFVVKVYGIEQEDFKKYVDAVLKSGFTINYSRSDHRFDGSHITIIGRKNLSLTWFDRTEDPYRPPYMSVWLLS